ncbi:MAG: hypothetical protein HPY90_14620 [Syntrophothermus sp.]|uniref:hypothetical protein n=1 Tax=Syntrophothermus sp. TaxID=2736299 RepID=UPI00257D36CA|nr:hypothetical protein [Syntrophothermus sp.]NSW84466.1 hypothetical protein [Syntrophothermus sp.]
MANRRFTINDWLKKNPANNRARARVMSLASGGRSGDKPRDPDKSVALAKMIGRRHQALIRQGFVDMSRFKTERRIRFNVQGDGH